MDLPPSLFKSILYFSVQELPQLIVKSLKLNQETHDIFEEDKATIDRLLQNSKDKNPFMGTLLESYRPVKEKK